MALIAHTIKRTPDGSPITTDPINTSGARLIVAVQAEYGYLPSHSISDNKGNTWTPLTRYENGSWVQLFYCVNPITSTSHTFTENGSYIGSLCVLAFDDPYLTFDSQNGTGGVSNATTVQAGAVAPTVESIFIAACVARSLSGAPSIDSGFTIADYIVGAYGTGLGVAYKKTTGSQNPTWTVPASGDTPYGFPATLAAFKILPTNWALASNGGVVTALSTYSALYTEAGVINGDRTGAGWGAGTGGWNSGTGQPQWLQVEFSGVKSISRIDLFTLQDAYTTPSEPTLAMTFTLYGVVNFNIEYWDGGAWVVVTGGAVAGNDKVWRQFNFSPVLTNKVRFYSNDHPATFNRVTEFEAWGEEAVNWAFVSYGAVASASSILNSTYPAVNCNNGKRHTNNQWSSGGGGWASAVNPTPAIPEWLEVDLGAPRTIKQVNVFTLADAIEYNTNPTLADTFSSWGITDFTTQYWDGSVWVDVDIVTANNKVWRQFIWSGIFTSKIRIYITGAVGGSARLVEVEAIGEAPALLDVNPKRIPILPAVFTPPSFPPTWTPSDLTQTIARYKAPTLGLADNDPVSSWTDIKGSFHATSIGVARPLYRTGAGSPYISFDGVNHFLDTTITNAFGDLAVFVVFRWTANVAVHGRIIDKNYNGGFWMGKETGVMNAGGGIIESGGAYGHYVSVTINTWYAMLFQRSGTTKLIRIGGTPLSNTVPSTACDATPIKIGESNTGGAKGAMDVKEIVICDNDLSSGEQTSLTDYALLEYGLVL